MEDNIDMANHSIVNLKEPEDHQATYAANVKFYCRLHSEFTNWSGHDNNIKQSDFKSTS